MRLPMIKTKRIYDNSHKVDGFRILVDRLWPRGLSKRKAQVDLWLKDIAPSAHLRKWFSHDPERWKEFQSRYKRELKTKSELLQTIKRLEREKNVVTLLFAAKDEKQNNAVALKNMLR